MRLAGYACRFAQAQLIEVNAHSLFSKWFSESGKLVATLFGRIREAVEEENTLVFVLVDEVFTAPSPSASLGTDKTDTDPRTSLVVTQKRGVPAKLV